MSATPGLEVVSWGIGGAVVDGGTTGRGWLGVPRGGAVDQMALGLANRLVGNGESAPAVETSGGLVMRAHRAVVVAATGAVADISVEGGPPLGWGAPVALPPGATVRVRRLIDGARSYVAVRGGIRRIDDRCLAVGDDPQVPVSAASAAPVPRPPALRLWPGPRLDALDGDAWERLVSLPATVTATSRVGCRLSGLRLAHCDDAVLESEGLLEGAVQVPPDGDPIVMLADHPTTGGYPVVAVVDPDDLWAVAQAAVGTTLRFAAAARRRR